MITYTEENPPATRDDIKNICSKLKIQDAAWIVRFWNKTDGALLNDQVVIYSTSTIVERNQTYNIASNHNDMLAIGDDSGGQAILTHKDQREEFYLVDHGSPNMLHSTRFESIEDLMDYLLADQFEEDPDMGNITTIAGVTPSLSEIRDLKKIPGVEISIIELKSKFGSGEQTIISSVYFQRYQKYLELFSGIIKFEKINR